MKTYLVQYRDPRGHWHDYQEYDDLIQAKATRRFLVGQGNDVRIQQKDFSGLELIVGHNDPIRTRGD